MSSELYNRIMSLKVPPYVKGLRRNGLTQHQQDYLNGFEQARYDAAEETLAEEEPPSVYGMTPEQVEKEISILERQEVAVRDRLAELKLNYQMRRHVEKKNLRDQIAELQDRLRGLEE